MIQVVVLLALMFHYNKQSVYLLLFLPCYAGVVFYLASDLATLSVLSSLQTSVIPIMLLSRVYKKPTNLTITLCPTTVFNCFSLF